MVKALTYDIPDHRIKLNIRQFQVMGKNTRQINNTGYEWYIDSKSMQSPVGAYMGNLIFIHFFLAY